ncbi:hypothetical protein NDK47_22295 [Brevibacillus ruminantium]|uniref:Uncharacterized protein n=1 Tax=Brevibacillus ruminantium TaxID=2950604 RepID=A0ABY4WJJ3_9BACL|nr:hypothetical protein [Brevibacillus ruminantium]USG64826.1 hypothetical protein NDK47_22295 [Brevibacillus ruminantium]
MKKKSWFAMGVSLAFVSAISLSAHASPFESPKAERVGTQVHLNSNSSFVDDLNNPKDFYKYDGVPQAEKVSTEQVSKNTRRANDPLNDSIQPFSKDVPTEFWNIDRKGTYTANIYNLRSLLYTNYYFQPSPKGELYVETDINEDYGKSATYTIHCYDLSTGKSVTNWKGTAGTVEKIRFYNLNESKNYYFGFDFNSNTGTLSGTADISYK